MGAENMVASAERWLLIGPTAFDGLDASGDPRTLRTLVDAAPVTDADHHGAFAATEVAIHNSFVPDVGDALDEGATVWLAMSSLGVTHEEVAYPLARSPDGSHRFVGASCPNTSFLQQRLGDTFDDRMEAIVGLTDHREIMRLLQPPA
jgi:hypothetical protein